MKITSAFCGGCLTLLVLAGGTPALGAVPGVPESWPAASAAGWVNHDLVNERFQNTLTTENSALKLLFKSQSMLLPPEEYVFEAGSNASSGRFTGDYVAQGVSEIRFRLFCERQAEVSLVLWSEGSSRVWRYRIPNIRTGEWMNVSVPMAIPVVRCINDAAQWSSLESDLRQVKAVGVAVERAEGMAAQSYWLDDFVLAGAGPGFATWMEQFPSGSGSDGSVLAGADLDGDGSLNRDEWVAGTSAGDDTDQFRVSIENATPDHQRLRWKAAPGRTYQVWSTTDLSQPFTPASTPMAASAPENLFEAESTNGMIRAFYRVTVECPEP
jgi:hypothetical protein